jgi:hypothetical protein
VISAEGLLNLGDLLKEKAGSAFDTATISGLYLIHGGESLP